ncbi:MAG TPA: hypothetical protein PLR99_21205 [Polyangiaceae bacterium]|nr:hypothetical protein [Polyangiaceae bacterium]
MATARVTGRATGRGLRGLLGLATVVCWAWAYAACSADPGATDGVDGSTSDVSSRDAASPDSAPPVADGGPLDASPADTGPLADTGPQGDILGTLSGSCGEVRAELLMARPSLKADELRFVAGETYERASLSPGGQKIFDTPNAGGSSTESEVMSYEVLRYCEGAKLLKTETEVSYVPVTDGGSAAITDLMVEIDGKKVGVSVTRAYKPQSQGAQTDAELKTLLEKKLDGINASTAHVAPSDKWVKQVLHVFAATQASADGVQRVWMTIDAQKRADTVVLVTRTTGGGFVYCNPDPPLGQECP